MVINFHDIPEAKAKWSDMEKFHHLRELGLAPVLPSEAKFATDDLIWGLSPCEYSAPDKDPA
jgi:hypothetical protein